MTETFRHNPTAMTLGDLRRALADAKHLPDDHPVQVVIPTAPSSTPPDLGTVAYPARGWLVADAHENWIEGDDGPTPGTEFFEIVCDYRPGEYRRDTLRRVDADD